MVAITTVLLAFPCGFFFRSRLAGHTAYAVAYLWAFVFQGVYLMLASVHGDDDAAFEPGRFPLSYGIVTLTIFAVGLGLVNLGHWVRRRRQASSRSDETGTIASAASGNAAASANVAG
jgi:hypothetical protein